jgi:hypothetical protein
MAMSEDDVAPHGEIGTRLDGICRIWAAITDSDKRYNNKSKSIEGKGNKACEALVLTQPVVH